MTNVVDDTGSVGKNKNLEDGDGKTGHDECVRLATGHSCLKCSILANVALEGNF